MKPMLVSVIIPIYNRGEAIAPTIESVMSQTLPHGQFEIILVDDGSADDTLHFLNVEYSKCEPIRIFSQPNAGVANARNRGLQVARGEFVAFLDHDDLWLPEKLEKQIEVLQAQPDIGVVYCGWQNIENEDDLSSTRVVQSTLRKTPTGNVYAQLLRWNFIVSMSVPLIRADLLREIGGFDARVAPNDDWDLWLRLAQKNRFACVREVLVLYRRHGAQQSLDASRMIAATRGVYENQQHFATRHRRFWRSWITSKVQTLSYQKTLPLFQRAQRHLFAAHFVLAAMCWLRAFTTFPAPFSRQWLYLLRRALKRNSQPY